MHGAGRSERRNEKKKSARRKKKKRWKRGKQIYQAGLIKRERSTRYEGVCYRSPLALTGSQVLISRIKDRARRKAALSDRKSAAAQARMKSIANLASDDRLSKSKRKGGGGQHLVPEFFQ